MTWHGYLPDHDCKGCGKPLQGEMSGRPAELYAGTYTGLCYGCERAPARAIGRLLTGAYETEHPPSSPSWRRDRERFLWFADCVNPRCRKGAVQVYRSGAFGGSYRAQCDHCSARHHEHPVIVEMKAREDAEWDATWEWMCRCNAEFERRCRAAGLDPDMGDEKAKAIGEAVLAEAPPRPEGTQVPDFPKDWARPRRRSSSRRRRR